MKIYKPVVLVILDGWGESGESLGNPFVQANLPTIELLNQHYPKILCQASGLSVGLPWGVCGNSEVGHQTIGTGQVVYQNLPVISLAIQDGSFFENKVLLEAFSRAKKNKKKLHLLGLLSDGGVHSHIEHLLALLDLAQKQEIEDVYLHLIADGRDVAPKSLEKYWQAVQEKITTSKTGKVATLMGRFYGMDRNNNWERTEKAFRALTLGEGILTTEKEFLDEIKKQYKKDVSDEFLPPFIFLDGKKNFSGKIESGDEVIFFNFRKDRARQISRALTQGATTPLAGKNVFPQITLTTFADYDEKLPLKKVFVFPEISAFLGEEIALANKRQLRIAETEKYAHVTYFFNGGNEKPFLKEERILIDSKKVDSYDQVPEMSAKEITNKLLEELEKNKFDFILVNYANPDMVGHTGNFSAAIKALEVVDSQLKRLMEKVLEKNGCLLISADHGNVEEMINLKNGEIDKEHSSNPVPCWLVAKEFFVEEKKGVIAENIEGMIVDFAPTILDLIGLKKNPKMDGMSLLDLFERKI